MPSLASPMTRNLAQGSIQCTPQPAWCLRLQAHATCASHLDRRHNFEWKYHTQTLPSCKLMTDESDVPLEERLQTLLPWAKTMLSVISQSVCDTRAQLHTGHQDIRIYFSKATAATPPTTTPTTATPTFMILARQNALILHGRQRFQNASLRHSLILLEERPRLRTSDLVASAKTVRPLIHQSIHDANSISEIKVYVINISNMTATESTTTTTPTATTEVEPTHHSLMRSLIYCPFPSVDGYTYIV
jgi:hypothetical protein